MYSLTITDLARSEQLDRPTMAALRGGWKMASFALGDAKFAASQDSAIAATQNLAQMQDVVTATVNGSAFVHGVHVDSQVDQHGENKIVRR